MVETAETIKVMRLQVGDIVNIKTVAHKIVAHPTNGYTLEPVEDACAVYLRTTCNLGAYKGYKVCDILAIDMNWFKWHLNCYVLPNQRAKILKTHPEWKLNIISDGVTWRSQPLRSTIQKPCI